MRRLTLLEVGVVVDAFAAVLHPIGAFVVSSLATLATARVKEGGKTWLIWNGTSFSQSYLRC
jgi:hypothetical protein